MATIVEAYEGFTLYLRAPLLMQDDANHDKEINRAGLED